MSKVRRGAHALWKPVQHWDVIDWCASAVGWGSVIAIGAFFGIALGHW